MGPECLQRRRLHSSSGEPLPVLRHHQAGIPLDFPGHIFTQNFYLTVAAWDVQDSGSLMEKVMIWDDLGWFFCVCDLSNLYADPKHGLHQHVLCLGFVRSNVTAAQPIPSKATVGRSMVRCLL